MNNGVIVVDNFLNNPLETRNYALSLPFTTTGNYPGKRTHGMASNGFVPFFEKFIGERITWYDTHPFSYNGAFQLATEADGTSWIHCDCTDWAAVLFLTPDAPVDSGLTLYRHVPTGRLTGDPNENTNFEDFQPVTTVGNVFNRLVLFRGNQFHKASSYFGGDPKHSRLFQVFFFNTVSPALHMFSTTTPRVLGLIPTTNRYDYLRLTLAALRTRLDTSGCSLDLVCFDDWPSGRDNSIIHELASKYTNLKFITHTENKGLPATWAEMWDYAKQRAKDYDYVLHIEEDAVLQKPIKLLDLIRAYTESPKPLSQIFLKRNVCYPTNDFIEDIDAGTLGEWISDSLVTQDRYFITLFSLYPIQVPCRWDYDQIAQEHTVLNFYARMGLVSGMFAAPGDSPAIQHVGQISRGIKGPGFDFLSKTQDYDYITGDVLPKKKTVAVLIPTTKERRPRLQTAVHSVLDTSCIVKPVIMAYENDGEGYVAALYKMLDILPDDLLVWCLADDVVCEQPGTLDSLVEAFENNASKKNIVVCLNDGIQCGRIATAPLCTVHTLKKWYDPRFFHNFADTLFTERARAAGSFVYLDHIKITHNHPCVGRAPVDDTYNVAQARWNDDETLYHQLRLD